MLLQQTGNGKRNGQFSELLISSGDTLRGRGGGVGDQRAAVLCKWPTMLSAAGGGASVC